MTERGRKAIQESNSNRHIKCGKCGNTGTEIVDGARIGGMPGIKYRYCHGCGWSRSVCKRPTSREMLAPLLRRSDA